MRKWYIWIVVLILLSIVSTGIFLAIAPEQIPAHYNAQGQVDRWGSKYELLLFAGIDLVFGAIMIPVARHEGKKGSDSNGKMLCAVTVTVLLMFNILWIFFMAKAMDPDIAENGLGSFSAKGIGMLVMGLFILLGNMIPKVRRNSVFGLRTKWSMASDACWQKSQRLGGFSMVVSGLAGIILLALLPAEWMAWVVLGVVAVLLAVTLPGSYLIYRKEMAAK